MSIFQWDEDVYERDIILFLSECKQAIEQSGALIDLNRIILIIVIKALISRKNNGFLFTLLDI